MRSRGWCKTHYEHWRVLGDPLAEYDMNAECPLGCGAVMRKHTLWRHTEKCLGAVPTLERLFEVGQVEVGSDAECWEWGPSRTGGGYGRLANTAAEQVGDQYAHRVALALYRGKPFSPEERALHHCDNPPCVNPSHLYAGTMADNSRDMVRRGRQRGGAGRGRR